MALRSPDPQGRDTAGTAQYCLVTRPGPTTLATIAPADVTEGLEQSSEVVGFVHVNAGLLECSDASGEHTGVLSFVAWETSMSSRHRAHGTHQLLVLRSEPWREAGKLAAFRTPTTFEKISALADASTYEAIGMSLIKPSHPFPRDGSPGATSLVPSV